MDFPMTSEEFIIEFKKQYRDKAKFMFDLDIWYLLFTFISKCDILKSL